jgi:hypothetical protein
VLLIVSPSQLAQWAASRADLFPDMLCDKMGMLHSNGEPHSIKHTRRVIEAVFQRPLEEVFEEFEEKPIGIGAIAQVCRMQNDSQFLGLTSIYRYIERNFVATCSRHRTWDRSAQLHGGFQP